MSSVGIIKVDLETTTTYFSPQNTDTNLNEENQEDIKVSLVETAQWFGLEQPVFLPTTKASLTGWLMEGLGTDL